MRKAIILLLFLVFLVIVMMSTPVLATKPEEGPKGPFQEIWDALSDLQAQIYNIQLIPGPPGPQGPAGPPGEIDTAIIENLQNQIDALQNQIDVLLFHWKFLDLGDGTVLDTSTQLIWLRNANCFDTMNWDDAMTAAAGLADGQCGLTDGSAADDWRLPTKEEWEAFVDTRFTYPALSNAEGSHRWSEGDAFNNVQSSAYWSGTLHEAIPDRAWYVGMGVGGVFYDTTTASYYVWPVRDAD